MVRRTLTWETKIRKSFSRLLQTFLASGNSPEKIRETFLRALYAQIGLYITVANAVEVWLRPELFWISLPSSLVGLAHLFILPVIWPKLPYKDWLVRINILGGVFFLTQRITYLHGLHGPNMMWFVVFPVFAQAFTSLRFTLIVSFVTSLCVVWVGLVHPLPYFSQSPLAAPPEPIVFGVIAGVSILLITYFAFLSEIVDRRIALFRGKTIAQMLQDTSEQSLGRIARSVVHNMRTPLSTLSLSTEVLDMKLNGLPALAALEESKQKIDQVVKALLYITDSNNTGVIEEFEARHAIEQAIAASTSISHLPSLKTHVSSDSAAIYIRGDRLAFSKLVWRLARVMEPFLAQSTTPALFVEAQANLRGLELKLEVRDIPANALPKALLKDLETQATQIRRALLLDHESVSVHALQTGVLSILLNISSQSAAREEKG